MDNTDTKQAKQPLIYTTKRFEIEKVSATFYDPFYDEDFGSLAALNKPLAL